jgi:hypothetical protein
MEEKLKTVATVRALQARDEHYFQGEENGKRFCGPRGDRSDSQTAFLSLQDAAVCEFESDFIFVKLSN